MQREPGIHSSDSTGWSVSTVAETGSTNADLLGALDSPTPPVDHTVLRTEHQTAGRGRLDRRWDAPPGSNLLVSLLFRDPPRRAQVVTQAVAVAATRAVDRVVPASVATRVSIKWPNDLLLGDRKLAGVLAQRHQSGAVVVGIGLNVGWAPDGAASLAISAADPSVSVDVATPASLLDALLDELTALHVGGDLTQPLDESAIRDAVRARSGTVGRRVRIELPDDRSIVGDVVDLDVDGRLIVQTPSGRQTFDVGDIVHLRAHGDAAT